MVSLWYLYGIFMVFIWYLYGIYMVSLWYLYGIYFGGKEEKQRSINKVIPTLLQLKIHCLLIFL